MFYRLEKVPALSWSNSAMNSLYRFLIWPCVIAAAIVTATSPASSAPAIFHFAHVPATSDGGSSQTFDAGVVSQASSPRISHRFIIENESEHPVTLARIITSGTGVSAAIDNDAQIAGFAIAAGDLVGVTLTVTVPMKEQDLAGKAEVYITGQPAPAASLTITATSSRGYALLTKNVNFGAVKVGASVARPVHLLVTSQLLASRNYPVVVSADPDIRIDPPGPPIDPEGVKGVKVPAWMGKGTRMLTFTAVFSPLALAEDKQRQLWLTPSNRSIAENAEPHLSILGHGSAIGEISIERVKIDFGQKVRGTDWSEWALISASSSSVFKELRFNPGSVYLQLNLVDPATHLSLAEAQKIGPNSKFLQVILSAVAPIGKIEATINVRAPSGQTYSLPVRPRTV